MQVIDVLMSCFGPAAVNAQTETTTSMPKYHVTYLCTVFENMVAALFSSLERDGALRQVAESTGGVSLSRLSMTSCWLKPWAM